MPLITTLLTVSPLMSRLKGSTPTRKMVKAVVFDLDYTLWPCWCDTHIYPPVKSKNSSTIVDRHGTELSFYSDVEKVFSHLVSKDIIIIAASRTSAPDVALDMLNKLHILDKPAILHFSTIEFGTNSKINHIKRAVKTLKIELKFEEIILFDDEMRNKDVESIGVQFEHVPDGLTYELVLEALDR